jgi:hypothetical protein
VVGVLGCMAERLKVWGLMGISCAAGLGRQ